MSATLRWTNLACLTMLLFELVLDAAGKKPAEDLNSPPPVTARNWAIADGRTGRLLWGFNENQPVKSASTTKIMCAHVILKLAEKQADILKERVIFSRLADNTPGSTADISAGESVTVADCLYGLLLPSGNDAGNALAEHFNARFAPPEPDSPPDLFTTNFATRAHFIAEMNRTARRLALTSTIYRSAYGDGGTDDDRTTTASDLLRLTWTAMQSPLFRQYVGTRKYTARVLKPNGAYRDAVWENSNQLLEMEGYDGVKTGTTSQAGNCLVASRRRGEDHLLVVVLGSTTGTGRFVDARNLFRWAWLQRIQNAPPRLNPRH